MKHSPKNLRAWAEINLGALERNLKQIRQHLPPYLKYISVVKADAYGHGLAPVVTRLMRSQADAFAVANLEEALRIKTVGAGWPTLLLSPLLPAEIDEAVRARITPVVSSQEECQELNQAARKQNQRLSIHLKIDSGMGRIGVWWERAGELFTHIQKLENLKLDGICTHFSTADNDPEYTHKQRTLFLKAIKSFQLQSPVLIHADNSAGVENFPNDGNFNACRIGLLQFGIKSHKDSLFKKAQLEPILSLHARIGLIKKLPKGSSVSYGNTYKLKRDSFLATLTIGYGDGYPLSASNQGEVLIKGKRCPIIGRITMDQIIVDLTDLPSLPNRGDLATLIGGNESASISAEELALKVNSIPWQILTGITSRVTRIYNKDSTT